MMSGEEDRAMAKTKILIDCDPGHDDAVALLFAARHLDLVAVTTVHGNNSLANTTRNALAILELAGIDVPLAAGCAEPLVQQPAPLVAIHGRSGLDGADIPAPTRRPIERHAVDLIVETAARHRGELVVALIGPQTNFAVALRREPRLKEWVREVTIMGGSAGIGNKTPVAEFNIYSDPEAAAVVFASGLPIRMVGYDITRRTGFDADDLARLKAGGRKIAALIGDLMGFYLAGQNRAFGLSVAPMHDVCAIIPHVAPELIRYVETSVTVELTGTYTRGMTVCDLRGVRPGAVAGIAPAGPATVKIAVEADRRAVVDRVIDTVLSFD
jgi:inosine-uridine nucleoside N-ribohydrolase